MTETVAEYDPTDGHWVGQHFLKPDSKFCVWECQNCGLCESNMTHFGDFDCKSKTTIHAGPATYLCNVGMGHVCNLEDEGRFKQLLHKMEELHDAKRSDYTGTSGDILWNYRNSAKLAGITTAQGMFARLCEKVVRISSVLSKGGDTQVTDEKLTDTYFDLAVIALLCIIESEERA